MNLCGSFVQSLQTYSYGVRPLRGYVANFAWRMAGA